jgi:hypothetical protein
LEDSETVFPGQIIDLVRLKAVVSRVLPEITKDFNKLLEKLLFILAQLRLELPR